MGKLITTAIATKEGYPPLEFVTEHDDGEQPSRESIAFGLLLRAQDRHVPPIPDGARGANREERLAEFGYRIKSITSKSAEPSN